MDNYIKVSVTAGNSLPSRLIASSIRASGSISDEIAAAMGRVRETLAEELPQISTSMQASRIWSWVFPFCSDDRDSLRAAIDAAEKATSDLYRLKLDPRRSLFRPMDEMELPLVGTPAGKPAWQ